MILTSEQQLLTFFLDYNDLDCESIKNQASIGKKCDNINNCLMINLEMDEEKPTAYRYKSVDELVNLERFFDLKNVFHKTFTQDSMFFQYRLPDKIQYIDIVTVQVIKNKKLQIRYSCELPHLLIEKRMSYVRGKVQIQNLKKHPLSPKFTFQETRILEAILYLEPNDEKNSNINVYLEETSQIFEDFIAQISDPSKRSNEQKFSIEAKIKSWIEKLRFYIQSDINSNIKTKAQTCCILQQIQEVNFGPFSEKDCRKVFTGKVEEAKKQKKDLKKPNILRSIQINKFQYQEWSVPETIFSRVNLIRAHYQINKISIHDIGLSMISEEESQQCQRLLVEKIPKKDGKKGFKVEVEILKHLRNQICPNIATFYLKELPPNRQTPDELYSYFYEERIDSRSLSIKTKFKAMFSLAEGLWFLSCNNILHRDLKPGNVMIDKSGNITSKIIDFGSAMPLNRSIQKQLHIDDSFATTEFYNIFYEDLPHQVQNIYSSTTYVRHENFDIHAFGVMLKTIINDDKKRKEESFCEYLCENLQWVEEHTLLKDPTERMNPAQLMVMMRILMRYYTQLKRNK